MLYLKGNKYSKTEIPCYFTALYYYYTRGLVSTLLQFWIP